MTEKQSNKALMILNYYDSKAQKMKCCEELAELTSAILKHLNKGGNEEAVLEELADAYIMLEQLKHMMPFGSNRLDEMIDFKLDRQMKRIRVGNASQ